MIQIEYGLIEIIDRLSERKAMLALALPGMSS